jgi:hypothetical protein
MYMGSFTRDFEKWMKGAQGMEGLSLKKLTAQGLEGGLICWEPGRYVKKASGYRHLFPNGPIYVRGEPGIRRGLVYRGM